jgi:N-acetyl sugar amidotransferase
MLGTLPEIFQNLKPLDPKKKVVYCKKCVVSNQRPRLLFNNDGICAACLYAKYKKNIDWDKREKELEELCSKFRKDDGSWDVIVPGSGGKDSGYVSWYLKEKLGMHPLTVTWAPSIPTEIGQKNLYDFLQSGYDNIMGTPNGKIHRKLSKITFEEFGDNFLPFVYGQLNYPFQIAVKFNIPLIFYGEDGDVEYGGSFERFDKSQLDSVYTVKSKFTSLPPEYWEKFGISKMNLKFYQSPSQKNISKIGAQAHYFSYFKKWSPEEHYKIAKQELGFTPDPDGRSEGTYTDFASLDDKSDGFHYYLALIKFGIGRTTSDASHQIRDGIITRDEGVELVQKYDTEFPSKYLKEFLDYIDIDNEKLTQIIDKFRRPLIWGKQNNEWELKQPVKKL